jgi:hypothetical protein
MEQVYLAKKNGAVVYHTDLAAMKQLDGIENPEKIVPLVEWEAAGNLARIIAGQIVLGKTQPELENEVELAGLNAEQVALQAELDAGDYKIVKAAESGLVLAQSDPALHERREWCRSRISEIRVQIAELGPDA